MIYTHVGKKVDVEKLVKEIESETGFILMKKAKDATHDIHGFINYVWSDENKEYTLDIHLYDPNHEAIVSNPHRPELKHKPHGQNELDTMKSIIEKHTF